MASAIMPKSVAAAIGAIASAPASSPGVAAPVASCSLVNILPSGVEANEYPLKPDGQTTIGRKADVSFPQDSALNDVHAVIVVRAGKYIIEDQGSEAGVLFQSDVERTIDLDRGGVIRAGRQWLVVGDRKLANLVTHYDEAGKRLAQFELKPGTTVIGRQSPDITIAPDDGALSRRHFALTFKDGIVVLKDLGSANGTQVRVSRPMRLRDGDRIMLGQQVLEFRDDGKIIQPPTNVSLTSVSKIPLSVTQAMAGKAPEAAGPGVFFEGANKLAPCAAGQTICEAAEKAGIKLDADCHQGVCGMDPVKIISGGEHVNPMGGTERSTLEDLCSLDPATHRLACMARVSGMVKVNIIKQ
jgi:ferredoxin